MEEKFILEEMTAEEQNDFMSKFFKLLEQESVYFEPVPQFSRESLQSPWEVKCQVILKRKVKKEDESTKEN